jgi:phage terminase large subunit-like protein
MANVVIEMDAADNIKLTKAKLSNKIDPAVLVINAFATFYARNTKIEFISNPWVCVALTTNKHNK